MRRLIRTRRVIVCPTFGPGASPRLPRGRLLDPVITDAEILGLPSEAGRGRDARFRPCASDRGALTRSGLQRRDGGQSRRTAGRRNRPPTGFRKNAGGGRGALRSARCLSRKSEPVLFVPRCNNPDRDATVGTARSRQPSGAFRMKKGGPVGPPSWRRTPGWIRISSPRRASSPLPCFRSRTVRCPAYRSRLGRVGRPWGSPTCGSRTGPPRRLRDRS